MTPTVWRRAGSPPLNTDRALEAADYLMQLLDYSPPDILSMSWYERVRPYGAGHVAMAYGYTLLAPYFELNENSPAHGNTGYLPHPHGPNGSPIAPVGGTCCAFRPTCPRTGSRTRSRRSSPSPSPGAQKLYAQNGSRTEPRYSVGADPKCGACRRFSGCWTRCHGATSCNSGRARPIPQVSHIIDLCGRELHDMLRGIIAPRAALDRIQSEAETILKSKVT